MIPRETMIALAKLHREMKETMDALTAEVAATSRTVEARYAPKVRQIQESIDQHRAMAAQHVSLTDELYWRIYDRHNHTTDSETTKKMKRTQRAERKRRASYEA